MKTRNPSYGRPIRQIRGDIAPTRAGSRGITFRDSTTEAHPVRDLLVIGGTITDLDDGGAILTISGQTTIIGTVTPDGAPFAASAGTSYRSFPGMAWIDRPYATVHIVGERFLLVYRQGTTHLVGGKIVVVICTITDTDPWTYTTGTPFDIEDVANDLRVDDSASVVDIGGSDYAVVAAREYNGTVNLSPHLMICDDDVTTMTSSSTWTRRNVALSGHTQDFIVGRVLKLQNDRYMVVFGHIAGTTHTNGVAWVLDVEDWSAPNFETITTGTANRDEMNLEEMPNGTLRVHIRNDGAVLHEAAASVDSGDTWSALATLYAATGFPTFRRLNSGIGLTVYRSATASLDTAWRTTAGDLAVSDSGWGAETILDANGEANEYATILVLDDNHALVIYAVDGPGADPTDCDLWSQVFTDSTVYASDPGSPLIISDEGTPLATPATDLDFVGAGVVVSGTGPAKTITISGAPTGAAGGDLSGTYPNPSVVDDSHSHTAPTLPAVVAGDQHVHVVDEQFNGDASTTVFTLANAAVPDSVMGWVAGVRTPVTLGGTMSDQVTFSSAPGSGTNNVSIDYAAVAV